MDGYIIQVRRNNPVIDYGPTGDGEFKIKNRRFIWQGRVIRYYQHEASGFQFITHLDGRLRAETEGLRHPGTQRP